MRRIARTIACACAAAMIAGCVVAAAPAQQAQAATKPAQVKKVSVSSVGVDNDELNVKWKVVKGAKGYKITYSTKKSMKKAKTVTVKGGKKTIKTLENLKSCTKYYVKVRAYKSKKNLGKWSAKKSRKTNHAPIGVDFKLPTATADGYSAHTKCSVCGKTWDKLTLSKVTHATVNEYSWAELKAIADGIACSIIMDDALTIAKFYNLTTPEGKLDGTQTKSFTYNGFEYHAQIIGFYHDWTTDANKAGITFMLKERVVECAMNSTKTNEGGWESSELRKALNDTSKSDSIWNKLPSDITSRIVAVNKDTGEDAWTTDKLWLPSAVECFGTCDSKISSDEGKQYKLWADMGVTSTKNAALKRTAAASSTGKNWWLRSPHTSNSTDFRYVTTNGELSFSYPTNTYSVVPAFCF